VGLVLHVRGDGPRLHRGPGLLPDGGLREGAVHGGESVTRESHGSAGACCKNELPSCWALCSMHSTCGPSYCAHASHCCV
jgi:hypothetical protein